MFLGALVTGAAGVKVFSLLIEVLAFRDIGRSGLGIGVCGLGVVISREWHCFQEREFSEMGRSA